MLPAAERSPLPRVALPMAAAGMLAFVVLAAGIHLLRPDLHWWDAQMSRYLLAPHGGWLQAAYCALAVAIITIALSLRAVLARQARSAGPVLLFVAGAVALVVTAFAPMDGDDAAPTLAGWVHGVSAQAAFLCVGVGMLLQSAWMRHDPHWRPRMPWAFALAVSAFAGLWALVLVDGLPSGASQKAVIAQIALWFAAVWWWLRSDQRAMGGAPGPVR